MTEEWKPVAGFEGFYAVSSMGRVKSVCRQLSGNRPRTIPERIMAGSIKSNGYLHFSLRQPRLKQVKRHCHRLVAEAFLGPADDREVNHINGNKLDNCVSNLEWCSRAQNMAHAWNSGLTPFPRRSV